MKDFTGEIPGIALAPRWSMVIGQPALETLYADHYYRMLAVISAARSGDRILIQLALENYDAKGSDPEPKKQSAAPSEEDAA